MGHGFSLPRHDGLADYAERLAAAGAAALVSGHGDELIDLAKTNVGRRIRS
jgi:hypothetical protein